MNTRLARIRGFTLLELLMVIAIIAILAAIAIPSILVTDETRARQAIRELERELQTARMKAVTTNRAIQVRLNCPGAGMYRMVEAGTTWPDAGRCSDTTYPYPAPADAAYQTPPKPGTTGRRATSIRTSSCRPAIRTSSSSSCRTDGPAPTPAARSNSSTRCRWA